MALTAASLLRIFLQGQVQEPGLAAHQWEEALCLYHLLIEAESSSARDTLSKEDRARIERAHEEYIDRYCNGARNEASFASVKRALLAGIESYGVDVHTTTLQSAKRWRESSRTAHDFRQFSESQINATATVSLRPPTKICVGLASDDVVSSRPQKTIECPEDSTILALYHAVVPSSKKKSPDRRTRAYLLENMPESAHTRDGLRWTPVRMDDAILDLLKSRAELPPVIFVSRTCHHIVAIVGIEAKTGFRASVTTVMRRLSRPDSAVVLAPESGCEWDLDLYIRTLAEIPSDREVHYMIRGARHDKLGKWDERAPLLSPYTSDNYVIIS